MEEGEVKEEQGIDSQIQLASTGKVSKNIVAHTSNSPETD